MKTLKRNQLFIIKSFLNGIRKNIIDEKSFPELVSLQYDFKKNRYHLTAEIIMTVLSKNEFDLDNPHRLVGTYKFDVVASYGDDKVLVSCHPIEFVCYSSPEEVVTDKSILDSIISPFKIKKGGVQKCVDGLDEELGVVDVEVDESMLGCPVEAYACNDSPFSNASLE